jgi:periplasmic divalent cation tolerance protein
MKGSMALVRTTVDKRGAADALARQLVNQGLAACVHVQEVRSTYRWKGKVEETHEWLVEARALESRVVAVREAMLADHPYELPMVETMTVTGISKAYLDWARQG